MAGVESGEKPPKHEGKLSVSLLGRAQVATEAGRIVALPRKALLLFALLVVDGRNGSIGRDMAAEFMWENADASRRCGNLRNLLYRVRQAFVPHQGLELFEMTEREIAINSSVGYIDVVAFRKALSQASAQGMLAIGEAYRDELLIGQTSDGKRLSHWLRDRRAGLQREFVTAASRYLEADTADELPSHAQTVANKLIEVEATNEVGYRALMRLAAANSDRKTVTSLYNKLTRLLARDIQTKPDEQTRALYKRLHGDRNLPGGPTAKQAAPVNPVTINRYAPRIAVVGYRRMNGLRGDGETVALAVEKLVEHLWRAGSLIIQELGTHGFSDAVFRETIFKSTADYVVEIACRLAQGRPDISFRLTERFSREVRWTRSYRDSQGDLNCIQEAAYSILCQVEARETAKLSESPEYANAYRLALRGGRLLRTFDLREIRRGRSTLKSALSAVPDHIPALASLARSYVLECVLTTDADSRLLGEAEQVARKIVSLDPQNSRGYQELGIAQLYARQFEGGVALLHRARELNPSSPDVSLDLADALISVGELDKALSMIQPIQAEASSGADLQKLIVASAYYFKGQYAVCLRWIEAMANPHSVFRVSASAYAMLGEREKAAESRDAALEFNPEFDPRRWLSQAPLGNREIVQHYEAGLFAAGFSFHREK
jgi:DNA-binding SARP family transcriptional activator/tetratricopeptide (TPR) repeat protein